MPSGEHDFVVVSDKDIVDFNTTGLLPQSRETIQTIQSWLQPTNYAAESSEYRKHLASYTPGTGKWVQETLQYKQWITSPGHGALWIKAIPGAGKSVIAAQLASQLSLSHKCPVLYFFFRHIIITNQNPQSLVRDWMSQALDYSPLLQSKLKKLVDDGRDLQSVAVEELWQVLLDVLSSLRQVYCVVDALDEMTTGNESFLNLLAQLAQKSPSSVKLLLTSRPIPQIESVLKDPSILQINLRQQSIHEDITIYVKHRLSEAQVLQERSCEIQQAICSKAQGLFLYARLMMDEIISSAKCEFIVGIEEIWQRLPTGLGDMYMRMLLDHSVRSGVPQQLQVLILKWCTHASRPLRLLELSSMIDFMRDSGSLDLPVKTGSANDTKSIIRAACGPLLEIMEDETISIIHHSLTEFLINTDRDHCRHGKKSKFYFPTIDSTTTHKEMAVICVKYMISDWVNDWELNHNVNRRNRRGSATNLGEVRLKHSFLAYASMHWHHHVSHYAETDTELFSLLDIFLNPGSKTLLSWLEIVSEDSRPGQISPLHIAASKGLAEYARRLIHAGEAVNCVDTDGRTPLHRAAAEGKSEVVTVLLSHGASKDPDDSDGLKPLHLAASSNRASTVKLLLEAGVDPFTPKTKEYSGLGCGNSPSTIGATPIEYAFKYGHFEAACQFLPYLDVEGMSKALNWAAGAGKTAVALEILEAGNLDVNKRVDGQTPLFLAAYNGDLKLLRKLVEMGADAKIKSTNRFPTCEYIESSSPLCVFARNCRTTSPSATMDGALIDGLKLLLEIGCDVNEGDDWGRTALYHALSYPARCTPRYCSAETIQILLENGANPSIMSHDGHEPLHVIIGASEPVIEMLLSHGADINSRDTRYGRTPIFHAISNSSDEDLMVLIKHGADCTVQDSEGDTPLHVLLAQIGPSALKVKMLLENGADPNARNSAGDTPLHALGNFVDEGEILGLMVANGADLEARTTTGMTVLMCALTKQEYRAIPVVRKLLALGARIDAIDFEGQTVLHIICRKANSAAMVRALAEAGAEPKRCDFAGNTILHEAAKQSPDYNTKAQLELLETIIELGVSPSARNNAGQTPFFVGAGMNRNPNNSYSTDPLLFIMRVDHMFDINAADNKGVRPIHLAASISESQVRELLEYGADAAVLTIEGQSILHIACRTRQSNIVDLAVDLFLKSGKTQLIDQGDIKGRTALHYACRSGRSESVKMLLSAGANPNARDKEYCTPLDACAEFKEEDIHWSSRDLTVNRETYIHAASFLLGDPYRPQMQSPFFKHAEDSVDIISEHQTTGIREIVRLLVAQGADVTFMAVPNVRNKTRGRETAFDRALASDCEALVEELLSVAQSLVNPGTKLNNDNNDDGSDDDDDFHWVRFLPWNSFLEGYVTLRNRNSLGLLENVVKSDQAYYQAFQTLLRLENQRGVEKLFELGLEFLDPICDDRSPLALFTRWGYASILERLSIHATTIDKAWIEGRCKNEQDHSSLTPLLLLACERDLPNLDVIKVLVEKWSVDVNARTFHDKLQNKGKTALHLLADASHWWHSKALEYLIKHGADIEAMDYRGETPLQTAVKGKSPVVMVEILLRYGANPNTCGANGLSCLNNAKSNREVVRQLIESGADASYGRNPFLLDAIEGMDLMTVKLLASLGIDFNSEPPHEEDGKSDKDGELEWAHSRAWQRLTKDRYTYYPIHLASLKRFNDSESRTKMAPIIEVLLKGGADPFKCFKDKDTILHDICQSGGILEPFLALPNLDLEVRDSAGRTLLLSACSNPDKFTNNKYQIAPTVSLLLKSGANIQAIDDQGRTALHILLESGNTHQIKSEPDLQLLLAHDAGAQLVSQKDAHGETPLHYALKHYRLFAIEPLLAHGANPLEPDAEGNTALHYLAPLLPVQTMPAHREPAPHFARFLALGVPIDARNRAGETPLRRYVARGNASVFEEVFALFGEAGADFLARDKRGGTLLHALAARLPRDGRWAKEGEEEEEGPHVKACRALMRKGVDPELEDEAGRTVVDVAAARGNEEILGMFRRGS